MAFNWAPILSGLLKHPAAGVRRNALRVMPRTVATAQAISDICSVNDDNAHVRLQALLALSGISGKPAGLTAIWNTYRDVDGIATDAFASSGITAAGTKPCAPVLDAITTKAAQPQAQPRDDLRFSLRRGGFALVPNGRLANGELVVFDMRGRTAFRSRYDAAAAQWSEGAASGLKEPVYGYRFSGSDGSLLQGRISPLSSL